MNELWTSLRGQIYILTLKATPSAKYYKHPLHKPYYARRVKRVIQHRRKAWTAWEDLEGYSCDAAYLCFQQEQRRSRQVLRVERLSYEWKLGNSAKTVPLKFFAHVNRNK